MKKGGQLACLSPFSSTWSGLVAASSILPASAFPAKARLFCCGSSSTTPWPVRTVPSPTGSARRSHWRRSHTPALVWPRGNRRAAGPRNRPLVVSRKKKQFFSEFFQLPPKWGGAYCFSLPLQMQTRSKYAYLSQSLLKGTHEPALQNS